MWNGEENIAVNVAIPFKPQKSIPSWYPTLLYYHKAANLALYNKLPTAFNEFTRKIKSLSDDGEWITIATLPYLLERMSFINLDSGDLLIIGFQNWRKQVPYHELNECYYCYSKQFATIHKLHSGSITVLGTFDKVFCSISYLK